MNNETLHILTALEYILAQFSDCAAFRVKPNTIELDVCHRAGQERREFAYYRTIRFSINDLTRLGAAELQQLADEQFKKNKRSERLNTKLKPYFESILLDIRRTREIRRNVVTPPKPPRAELNKWIKYKKQEWLAEYKADPAKFEAEVAQNK